MADTTRVLVQIHNLNIQPFVKLDHFPRYDEVFGTMDLDGDVDISIKDLRKAGVVLTEDAPQEGIAFTLNVGDYYIKELCDADENETIEVSVTMFIDPNGDMVSEPITIKGTMDSDGDVWVNVDGLDTNTFVEDGVEGSFPFLAVQTEGQDIFKINEFILDGNK